MRRTVLALRNKHGKYVIPKFSDCLLEFFGTGINSVTINCSVEDGVLVLNESEAGCELRHSPQCPMKYTPGISDVNDKDQPIDSYIRLATSVAIESSDSHILLTQRSPNMRTSPNTWVLPGGHLDFGETVFEAGIRETKEETALDITTGKSSILGLWENVYPLLLGLGTPKFHALIVYLHVLLDEPYKELTKRIIPDPKEVSSYCWINAPCISRLFSVDKTKKTIGKQYIFENGKIVEKPLNYESMFNKLTWLQPEPYSGVVFALRKWLDRVNSRAPKSKF